MLDRSVHGGRRAETEQHTLSSPRNGTRTGQRSRARSTSTTTRGELCLAFCSNHRRRTRDRYVLYTGVANNCPPSTLPLQNYQQLGYLAGNYFDSNHFASNRFGRNHFGSNYFGSNHVGSALPVATLWSDSNLAGSSGELRFLRGTVDVSIRAFGFTFYDTRAHMHTCTPVHVPCRVGHRYVFYCVPNATVQCLLVIGSRVKGRAYSEGSVCEVNRRQVLLSSR